MVKILAVENIFICKLCIRGLLLKSDQVYKSHMHKGCQQGLPLVTLAVISYRLNHWISLCYVILGQFITFRIKISSVLHHVSHGDLMCNFHGIVV